MKNQIQQLTNAADNAVRLLDQLGSFELSSSARELVRDASAPLREALRASTLNQDTSPEMCQLPDHEIENGSLADKAKSAHYASLRAMLNDLRMWGCTVSEVETFLTEDKPWAKTGLDTWLGGDMAGNHNACG